MNKPIKDVKEDKHNAPLAVDGELTHEEHMSRHRHLHACLDELFADYIEQHPDEHQFTQMPLIRLIEWSYAQTTNPTNKQK